MHVIRKCLEANSWSRSNKLPTVKIENEYVLIGIMMNIYYAFAFCMILSLHICLDRVLLQLPLPEVLNYLIC